MLREILNRAGYYPFAHDNIVAVPENYVVGIHIARTTNAINVMADCIDTILNMGELELDRELETDALHAISEILEAFRNCITTELKPLGITLVYFPTKMY